MKIAEFIDQLKSQDKTGRINMITVHRMKGGKGSYSVMSIGQFGTRKHDVKNGKTITYTSLDRAKKYSSALIKSNSSTFLVEMNGTDFAKANVIKIDI